MRNRCSHALLTFAILINVTSNDAMTSDGNDDVASKEACVLSYPLPKCYDRLRPENFSSPHHENMSA